MRIFQILGSREWGVVSGRFLTTSHLPLATSLACKFKFNNGFGILEVLIAAVVLGFLIIGLNRLQVGNREVLLRVRERDAASFIAQHVLDSLGAVGINSIKEEEKDKCNNKKLVYCEENYTYNYEGNSGAINAPISYTVEVKLLNDTVQKTTDRTNLDASISNISSAYAKSLKAKVIWKYKGTDQSIEVAKVVR